MGNPLITLFILLSCTSCFGQSAFQELTPGASTRDDVARVLGQPRRSISSTLFEYAPPAGIANVEVEYRTGSDIVQRVEVYFTTPISRPALIQKFGLPQVEASKKSTEEKLVEYFGGSSLLALTYAAADAASGVSHMGYYSPELFDRTLGRTGNTGRTSGGSPGDADDPGMRVTDRNAHYRWAQARKPMQLADNLQYKLEALYSAPGQSDDSLSNAFGDISVIVARYVPNANCFDGDSGVIATDPAAHKSWATSLGRKESLNNLKWKVAKAFGCLKRSQQPLYFADVAVAKGLTGSARGMQPH